MAHCPMRLHKNGSVSMNPFGTYYGKQRHHHGRAKDQVLDAYTIVAAQSKSIAPSYNGNSETAVLCLCVTGDACNNPEETAFIRAFADGAILTAPEQSSVQPFEGENIKIKQAQKDSVSEGDLKNPVMTGFAGNLMKYIVYGTRGISHIVISQIKSRLC